MSNFLFSEVDVPVTIVSREEQIRIIKDTFHSLMWIAGRQFSQKLQTFGLTHPQFIALAALAAHKQACTMHDLTDVTFQDPPTMTGIIDRLEKMQLVQRTRSDADRRVVLVAATPKGIDLVSRIEAEIMQKHTASYAVLSDNDLIILEEILRNIIRASIAEYRSLQEEELDTEIQRLRLFKKDPIYYNQLYKNGR